MANFGEPDFWKNDQFNNLPSPWYRTPCPSCGYCPTCGRRRSWDYTWPNYTVWCDINDCGTTTAGGNISSSDYHLNLTDCVCQEDTWLPTDRSDPTC